MAEGIVRPEASGARAPGGTKTAVPEINHKEVQISVVLEHKN